MKATIEIEATPQEMREFLEVVPLIRTTCLGVIFPVNHAAINGMMVS